MSISQRELRIEQIIVTPEIAKDFLTHNSVNRNLSPKVVARYARDMASGEWEQNGDCIRFDRYGNLSDGQHRLTAIIESGASVPMIVAYGVDISGNIDNGYKRTDVANFQIKYGISSYTRPVEAALNNIVCSYNGQKKLTVAEKKKVYDYFEDEVESIFRIANVYNTTAIVKAGMIICMKFHNVGILTLSRFHEIFLSGFTTNEQEYQAIALRNDYVKNRHVWGAGAQQRRIALNQTIVSIIAFSKGRVGRKVTKYKELDYSEQIRKIFA